MEDTSSAWPPGRRVALVLSLLRDESSVDDAARRHGLAPQELEEWKRTFLRGAEEALAGNMAAGPSSRSRLSGSNLTTPAAAVTLGIAWLTLRIVFWNGYYTEDSPGYVTDAILTAVDGFSAREYVNGMNIGTFLPVTLPIALFGNAEFGLALWPLVCSLLGAVSLGVLCGVFFGRPYSLLASFLYITYPGDVFFSTVVMPDAIQAGWVSFAILLVVLAFTGPAPRKDARLLAAGAALGVCHLIRAGDAMFLPVGLGATALCAWRFGSNGVVATARDTLRFGLGWALIIGLEGLLYLALTGDGLLRFRVLNSHYGTLDSIGRWGLNHDPSTIPFSLFAPMLWTKIGSWGRLNQDQAYHGLLFCWALLALIGGAVVVVRDRGRLSRLSVTGFLLALMWFAWPLLYHQYGSQSLTQFVPIHRLSRQLVAYAPAAIFATVAGCFIAAQVIGTWRSRRRRRAAMVAAVMIAALHLHFNWQGERIAYEAYHRIKDTYLRIREHLPVDTQTIVGDSGDLSYFHFWLNEPGTEHVKMLPYEAVAGCDQIANAVVLTRSNPGWHGLSGLGIRTAIARLPCLIDPPAKWRLLYDGYPEKVYRVGQKPSEATPPG